MLNHEQAFDIARSACLSMPEWATHIAVSLVRGNCEPAMWFPKGMCYIDDDLSKLGPNDYAGTFKQSYWKIFSIAALNEGKETK